MAPFNLGINSQDAINDTNPFNSRIKHMKAQWSTMKVYQTLDHVQINPKHTFEFGTWKFMLIFPTNQSLHQKTVKQPQPLLACIWNIHYTHQLLETYNQSVLTLLHSFYSSIVGDIQSECVHNVTFILLISCWRHTSRMCAQCYQV